MCNGTATAVIGVLTKDDYVIIGNSAFQIVAGEVELLSNGVLVGEYEKRTTNEDDACAAYECGARVYEIADDFVGRWR